MRAGRPTGERRAVLGRRPRGLAGAARSDENDRLRPLHGRLRRRLLRRRGTDLDCREVGKVLQRYLDGDVDTDVAAARMSGELDRMERKGRAFHERVRAGYLAQVERDPQGYLLLDAGAPEEVVFDSLLAGLRARLA